MANSKSTGNSPINLIPIDKQIKHIVALRAQGKTYRDIQAEVGLSIATIHNRLMDDQAKSILEQVTKYHVMTLPVAMARHEEIIASDDESIALRAVELKYKITGITPSHTQNVFIGNLMIQNNSGLQDAAFRQVAGTFLGLDDEIQDAELIEPKQDNPAL